MKAIYKYMFLLAAAPLLGACGEDEGTEPGTDPNPAVTLYTYAPTAEGTNPDNDVVVRFVTNNKATEVKYLAVPSADIESLDEAALLQKVESEGKVVENLKGDSYADITLSDLHGNYTVAAVANGQTLGNSVTFFGLDWETLHQGVFYYQNDKVPPVDQAEASLEVCTSDESLYRIKNVFGAGTALKMYMLDVYGEDSDGDKYRLFRVKQTATPWTYGNYGTVSVRDIGYWQNNEAFINGVTGYENGLYEDGTAFFCLQWNVSAGSLGYNISYFFPNGD